MGRHTNTYNNNTTNHHCVVDFICANSALRGILADFGRRRPPLDLAALPVSFMLGVGVRLRPAGTTARSKAACVIDAPKGRSSVVLEALRAWPPGVCTPISMGGLWPLLPLKLLLVPPPLALVGVLDFPGPGMPPANMAPKFSFPCSAPILPTLLRRPALPPPPPAALVAAASAANPLALMGVDADFAFNLAMRAAMPVSGFFSLLMLAVLSPVLPAAAAAAAAAAEGGEVARGSGALAVVAFNFLILALRDAKPLRPAAAADAANLGTETLFATTLVFGLGLVLVLVVLVVLLP